MENQQHDRVFASRIYDHSMIEMPSSIRCGLCGRLLKRYQDCLEGDIAMDCGGDCYACIYEIELAFFDPDGLDGKHNLNKHED
jgi:hypothetical protein